MNKALRILFVVVGAILAFASGALAAVMGSNHEVTLAQLAVVLSTGGLGLVLILSGVIDVGGSNR